MNRIREKLTSENGASLLAALLFFVICAIIGGVILTSASVASGRMTGLRKSNQEYYSLTSAAKLFKDTWGTGSLMIYQRADGTIIKASNNSYGNNFAQTRDAMVEEIFFNEFGEENPTAHRVYYISIPEDPGISDIKAEITMNSDYSTYIEFSYKNQEESVTHSFITLSFAADYSDYLEYNISKLNINWSNPQIYMGGALSQ